MENMLRVPDFPALQNAVAGKRKAVSARRARGWHCLQAKYHCRQTHTPTLIELINQYQARTGHTDYRLAKIAGISPSVISRIRSGRPPGWGVCNALANAMDLPHELLFRAAGLLPPAAEVPTLELDQLNRSFSKLKGWQKRLVLRLVNALLDDFHSG